MSDTRRLRALAAELCSELGAPCYSEGDPDGLVLLGLTWVENFYYVDPVECSRDASCVDAVLEMWGEVVSRVAEGRYTVVGDRELARRAVRGLLELEKTLVPPVIGSRQPRLHEATLGTRSSKRLTGSTPRPPPTHGRRSLRRSVSPPSEGSSRWG